MKCKYVLAIFMAGISSMAVADPYGGLAIGKVDHDLDGFSKPTGFELYLGNQFNKNVAAEISYVDFGDASDNIAPVWTVSASSIGVATKIIAPMSDTASLYARVGVHAWDAQLDEAGWGTLVKDSGTDLLFGFGGQFSLNENVTFGVRYTTYKLDDEDTSIFGVDIGTKF